MPMIRWQKAKAEFSAFLDKAMKGDIITITQCGKPVAALVSIEAAEVAKKSMRKPRPNFGEYLMTFPEVSISSAIHPR